jgi:DNA-binding IclR family transcriptional regulator
MSTSSASVQIRSIERAAAILRLLAGSGRGLGVAELALELRLSRGTIHGILRTLRNEQFVEQDADSGKYRIGETLLPMGFRHLEANQLRIAALGVAHVLARNTGQSVRVGSLFRGSVLIVHHVVRPDAPHQLLDVGSLEPAHATALGKALLCQEPDGVEALKPGPLHRFTVSTCTDVVAFERELEEVREQGWAREIGELSPGSAALAAPVAGRDGAKPGAISIEGSIDRLFDNGSPRPGLIGELIESARAVARRLGATPW